MVTMRESLNWLLKELKALKNEGVVDIYYEDGTLEVLRLVIGGDDLSVGEEGGDLGSEKLLENTVCIKPQSSVSMFPSPEVVELPKGEKLFQWQWLKERVLGSSVCKSHVKPGKKVVFGVGDLDAEIFFCGEAPGADEEIEGEPFVGKAGQLLTKIIQAMGLRREDVYIANIMNWRPEVDTPFGNRPPTREEMDFCLPYLKAQIEVVKPKVIVALGATAVNGLLGEDSKRYMGDIRGKWHEFEGRPLMVTFHPSYLLRNNTNRSKRLVWEDMMKVMERLKMPISDKQRAYFT